MDFQKSTNINMDIHIFWMSFSIIHRSVGIHIGIQAGISMQGPSSINKYSLLATHVFIDISLQLSMILWTSMDIRALTCYGFSIQGDVLILYRAGVYL